MLDGLDMLGHRPNISINLPRKLSFSAAGPGSHHGYRQRGSDLGKRALAGFAGRFTPVCDGLPRELPVSRTLFCGRYIEPDAIGLGRGDVPGATRRRYHKCSRRLWGAQYQSELALFQLAHTASRTPIERSRTVGPMGQPEIHLPSDEYQENVEG